MNQIIHVWKYKDDADRREHWAKVFANADFIAGAKGMPGDLGAIDPGAVR